MKIRTVKDFYRVIFQTRDFKRKLLEKILANYKIEKDEIKQLEKYVKNLEGIAQENGKFMLEYGADKTSYLNLDYEIDELYKDIAYLTSSETDFISYLAQHNCKFEEDVQAGLEFLLKPQLNTFISDRDGTVNNYCGRYNSSVQSIYNAIFLINYAKLVHKPVILTSAPLSNIGFLDINIMSPAYFVIAGSKGREFTWNGKEYKMRLDTKQQQKIEDLNKKLQKITQQPKYEIFALIGSGLQFKFGETTIARQDIYNSIPTNDSKEFLQKIKQLVRDIDPEKQYFSITDTGKDIEIVLNKDSNKAAEFTKGDGIEFISHKIGLNLENAHNLICGDTTSDLAMLEYAETVSENNYSIFVTQEEKLKLKVGRFASKNLFVNSPDALVTILYEYSKERSKN